MLVINISIWLNYGSNSKISTLQRTKPVLEHLVMKLCGGVYYIARILKQLNLKLKIILNEESWYDTDVQYTCGKQRQRNARIIQISKCRGKSPLEERRSGQ